MAKELAAALDKNAKKGDEQVVPGAQYRHVRDPKGDKDFSICTSQHHMLANLMLISK